MLDRFEQALVNAILRDRAEKLLAEEWRNRAVQAVEIVERLNAMCVRLQCCGNCANYEWLDADTGAMQWHCRLSCWGVDGNDYCDKWEERNDRH